MPHTYNCFLLNSDSISSDEYIETYSNDEKKRPYSFIYKLDDNTIFTKAIDLWKYYKTIINKKNRIKQNEFYNKISLFYGQPMKKYGVKCYAGIIIKN